MPEYQKARGIGNSVDAYLAPGTYNRDQKLKDIKIKVETEIRKQVAVKDWHKRMHDEEKKQSPEKYPELKSKLPSPGPGHYTTAKGPITAKTFQKPHQAAFGTNDAKRINKPDKV